MKPKLGKFDGEVKVNNYKMWSHTILKYAVKTEADMTICIQKQKTPEIRSVKNKNSMA